MSSSTYTLQRTGDKMPAIGFGTWKIPRPQTAETVYNAIKAGYRLFDGAADYGNEKEAGEGINRAISEGIVTREELWITSKVWNTNHKKEHVLDSAKFQLGLWGIQYFDLYLVHFPVSLEHVKREDKYPPEWWGLDGKVHPVRGIPFRETWEAMEELVDAGLAKNIGVSNTNGSLLIDIFSYARYQPQVLQVEIHPYLTQEALIKLTKDLDIVITAYCSFGPASWVELGMHGHVTSLLENDTVTKIAGAVGKSPAQVLLRWALQQGLAVIPKSNSADRLAANFDSASFDLSPEQIKEISSLNVNYRMNDPASIHPHLAIFA